MQKYLSTVFLGLKNKNQLLQNQNFASAFCRIYYYAFNFYHVGLKRKVARELFFYSFLGILLLLLLGQALDCLVLLFRDYGYGHKAIERKGMSFDFIFLSFFPSFFSVVFGACLSLRRVMKMTYENLYYSLLNKLALICSSFLNLLRLNKNDFGIFLFYIISSVFIFDFKNWPTLLIDYLLPWTIFYCS